MPAATSLERRLKQRRGQPQTAPERMESGGQVAVEVVMMVAMGDACSWAWGRTEGARQGTA
jgi:hypothetical protein